MAAITHVGGKGCLSVSLSLSLSVCVYAYVVRGSL